MAQKLLPGLPPPADDPLSQAEDPLDRLDAAVERLADIHRRQDALAGGKR